MPFFFIVWFLWFNINWILETRDVFVFAWKHIFISKKMMICCTALSRMIAWKTSSVLFQNIHEIDHYFEPSREVLTPSNFFFIKSYNPWLLCRFSSPSLLPSTSFIPLPIPHQTPSPPLPIHLVSPRPTLASYINLVPLTRISRTRLNQFTDRG